MPKYKVVDGDKEHDGKKYAPGDVMDVSAETAAHLRLVPVPEEEKEKKKGKEKE